MGETWGDIKTEPESVTIHWKAVEQYFTVVQFYPVCNHGNFIRFGLGTVRSERVRANKNSSVMECFQCYLERISSTTVESRKGQRISCCNLCRRNKRK